MGQHSKQTQRRPRWLAIAALMVGAFFAGPGQAATFTLSDAVDHHDWQSVTLSRGDTGGADQAAGGERHFRAVESVSYSDATLSVNATPGVCDMPWLEVRVALDDKQAEDQTADIVPAQLRVDAKTLHQSVAEFITERGDDGFYVHFYLNDREGLLNEMRHGKQLFLGFEQGERDPWYMTFSLDGADDAIGETLHDCRATRVL
ncbi:MAG: hypothetical protein L0I84_08570 [Halomonas subglaciescola]|nr:hypothetical protein [Halomonas subglaciescola]